MTDPVDIVLMFNLFATIPYWWGAGYFLLSCINDTLKENRHRLRMLGLNAVLYTLLLLALPFFFPNPSQELPSTEGESATAIFVVAALMLLPMIIAIGIAGCAYAIVSTTLIMLPCSDRRPWLPFVAGLCVLVPSILGLNIAIVHLFAP